MATYTVHVKRSLIPGKQLPNGKRKFMRVTHRKMLVSGNFFNTTQYRISRVRRNGETYYLVARLVHPQKELWPTLQLGFTAPPAPRWEAEDRLTAEGCVGFLRRLGVPASAFDEMEA